MKPVHPHHYMPTPDQLQQLKAHAAGMRGRIRAMRALRDTVSGFNALASRGSLEFIPTARSGVFINERTPLADGTSAVRLAGVLWI